MAESELNTSVILGYIIQCRKHSIRRVVMTKLCVQIITGLWHGKCKLRCSGYVLCIWCIHSKASFKWIISEESVFIILSIRNIIYKLVICVIILFIPIFRVITRSSITVISTTISTDSNLLFEKHIRRTKLPFQ